MQISPSPKAANKIADCGRKSWSLFGSSIRYSTTLNFEDFGEETASLFIVEGIGEGELLGGEDFSGDSLCVVGVLILPIDFDFVGRAEGLYESETVGFDGEFDSPAFAELAEVGRFGNVTGDVLGDSALGWAGADVDDDGTV